MVLKNFIVFEGCDGAGTSTQQALLCERLLNFESSKFSVFKTAEPTNGAVGRLIRAVLGGGEKVSSETLAYLFAADRNEHIFGRGGAAEEAARDKLVVCDRYKLSSLVYQGIDCGDSLPMRLNEVFPAPQLLVYFDIDAETAAARIALREKAAGQKKEIFENLDFQKKVIARYRELLPLCEKEGSLVAIIDARRSIEEVADSIWIEIKKIFLQGA